jgi:hypothetical protein
MAGRIAYYGNIATQGLVLNLDAAIQGSYPKTGSTWFDISNNGNNGTLISGSLYDPTVFGNVTFNGSASYVQFPVNSFPSGNADLSFNSWIKWNGDGINNGDFIIGYGNDTAANKVPLILIDPNKKARFEFGSSAGVVTSSFDIPTGSWTSITATYNRSFNTLYVNGSPVGNRAYNAAGIEPNGFNGLNGALGALFSTFGNVAGPGTTNRYGTFNGNIAVAQVYNIPLSQFQVWQNFNAYKSRYGIPDIVTDGLVLNLDAGNPYSYLSGSSGTTWTNTVAASSSISGSLVNGTTYSNGAMVFDGVDDYIEVPNNVALNSNIGTISVWFKSTTTAGRSAVLIGKTDSVGSYNGINILTSGTEIYGQVKGSSDQIISGSLLSQNTWYNFTLTYSSGISYSSYLNGSLIGTNTLTSFTFSTQPLRIARSLDSFWTTYKGQVSNAMIYNRALSAAEVQQNFNALRGRYGI